MTAKLRHAAGSLLVVGLAGTELTGLERAWLKPVCALSSSTPSSSRTSTAIMWAVSANWCSATASRSG